VSAGRLLTAVCLHTNTVLDNKFQNGKLAKESVCDSAFFVKKVQNLEKEEF
jgi:hypothetical protein